MTDTTNSVTDALQPVEWPVMPPSKGQSPVLFEDGYAEGWAKCLEACKAALAAADGTATPVAARWYFVTNDGAATLCVDEADAREGAAEADIAYPRMAPHRAVQLVPAAQLAAAVAANNSEHAHAMAVLRQIADMPRRTREQRLASACVRFLDAIRAGEPSDG